MSLNRILVGAAAVAVVVGVVLLQLQQRLPDLTRGNPTAGVERLDARTVEVDGRTVSVSASRTPAETLVDVTLPADLALVAGPVLVHDLGRFPAERLERTETGVRATFPPTESRAPLTLHLGPAVALDDPHRTVVVVAEVGQALERAEKPSRWSRTPPRRRFEFEPRDLSTGDPALVSYGARGVRTSGPPPHGHGEWVGLILDGTWHSEHGLLREGNWPEEFVGVRDTARIRNVTADRNWRDQWRLFDELGRSLTPSGWGIGWSRDEGGMLGWGETSVRVFLVEPGEVRRIGLVMQVEPAIIEGDHALTLQPREGPRGP